MKDFKKLRIWQKGIDICNKVYTISSSLKKSDQFIFLSQVNRSALSIPSNIAEGSSRRSQVEYLRYLEFALGSAFELETQIIVLYELKLIPDDDYQIIIELVKKEQKMINSLMKIIKTCSLQPAACSLWPQV